MNHRMSDEEFLDLVADLGVQVLPLFRKPIPEGHIDDLFRRLDAEKPFLRELTNAQMKVEILKLLKQQKKAMDPAQIVVAVKDAGYAMKGVGYGAILPLLRQLKKAGLMSRKAKADKPEIRECSITPKGEEWLNSRSAKSESRPTLWGRKLRPSPATE